MFLRVIWDHDNNGHGNKLAAFQKQNIGAARKIRAMYKKWDTDMEWKKNNSS